MTAAHPIIRHRPSPQRTLELAALRTEHAALKEQRATMSATAGEAGAKLAAAKQAVAAKKAECVSVWGISWVFGENF